MRSIRAISALVAFGLGLSATSALAGPRPGMWRPGQCERSASWTEIVNDVANTCYKYGCSQFGERPVPTTHCIPTADTGSDATYPRPVALPPPVTVPPPQPPSTIPTDPGRRTSDSTGPDGSTPSVGSPPPITIDTPGDSWQPGQCVRSNPWYVESNGVRNVCFKHGCSDHGERPIPTLHCYPAPNTGSSAGYPPPATIPPSVTIPPPQQAPITGSSASYPPAASLPPSSQFRPGHAGPGVGIASGRPSGPQQYNPQFNPPPGQRMVYLPRQYVPTPVLRRPWTISHWPQVRSRRLIVRHTGHYHMRSGLRFHRRGFGRQAFHGGHRHRR